MGRLCGVCQHPKLHEINRRLAAGEPGHAVARSYSIARSSMQRHRAKCAGLPNAAVISQIATQDAIIAASLPSREELGSHYAYLRAQIDEVVAKARSSGSLSIALSGLDMLRRNLDSVARLAIEQQPSAPGVTVNVNVCDVVNQLLAVIGPVPAGDVLDKLERIVDGN
jgi:hypothetical protein